MSKKEIFIKNTLLMSVSAILMRSVGVWFSVYLSGKLGEDGVGLYTLIMSISGFCVTFATSAVGFAATRTVSEALGEKKNYKIRSCMKKCLAYAAFFGTLACFLLLSLSRVIGVFVLKDERCVRSLRILAMSLPAIALSSAVNGYFTAVRRVSRSVAAGITEQGIRIFSVMALMSLFVPSDIEAACALVVTGSVTADLVSTLINMCLYFADLSSHVCKRNKEKCENSSGELLRIALPMAVSSYIRSGLSTLEHIFIPRGLKAHGLSQKETLAAYGRVHGMALQVILYPYALLTPFCSLLVPEIAGRRAAGDDEGVKYVASRAISFVLTFGIGCGVIMAAFAPWFGNVVYNSRGAGQYILLLAPLVPVMYLDTVADSILKGMGEQLFCMKVNIFDSLASVFIVLWLVPVMGIRGYVIEIVFCEVVNTAISVSRLCKMIKIKTDPVKNVLVPTLSATLSVFLTQTCMRQLDRVSGESGGALFLCVAASGVIYLLLNCLLRADMKNDLKSMARMAKKYLIFEKKGDTIRP